MIFKAIILQQIETSIEVEAESRQEAESKIRQQQLEFVGDATYADFQICNLCTKDDQGLRGK